MANGTANANGKVERLRYFKGQLLTAHDFETEQKYHRDRVENLLRRFPAGIVAGLEVVSKTVSNVDPDSFDGLLIAEGLAVDEDGNQIVVPADGIRILNDALLPHGADRPFLSLVYSEEAACAAGSACDTAQMNNRIRENVSISWVPAPNIRDENNRHAITLAHVKNIDKTFELVTNKLPDGRIIRIDARVIEEKNIKDGAVTANKIATDAVTEDKIKAGAVTHEKIANNAVRIRHIAPLQVTTEKIANNAILSRHIRAYDLNPELPDETGINAGHIQNDAIESRHIRDYDPANPNPGYGIKDSHIQNDAIVSRHIKVAEAGNAELGIKQAHIQNGAVTSSKIRYANGGLDSSNDNGIKTDHIRDSAVTTSKLSILDPDGTVMGTFGTAGDPGDPITEDNPVVIFDGPNFDKARFPHVLPITQGTRLEWNSEIERMPDNRMAYHFRIRKNQPGMVSYKIQFVRLT